MLLSPILQEYLIENGSLPLPATGRLTIQHTPAHLNHPEQTFTAPDSKIVFSDAAPTENELEPLITFIAQKLSISNKESKGLLEKELGLNGELKGSSATVNWSEWNLFQYKKEDMLSDPPQSTLNSYLPPFAIEKVFRQPVIKQTETESSTETATLSEGISSDETTSQVFTEIQEPVAKDYWWVWALIIFTVSVLLIVFRS